jgi:hypothetical protein
MIKYFLSFLLCLSFIACLKKDNKKANAAAQATAALDSISSIYTVVGDSLVIPTFEIEVRPSDKAAQTLKSKKETVIISAYFAGFPKDKKDEDEIGQMAVLDSAIELSVDNRVARFENLKFPKRIYNALSDKDFHLLINVFSGRRSSDDNLLDAGIVDKKASEFKDKRFVIDYKLINESPTSTSNAAQVAKCYVLPTASLTDSETPSILITCDERGNITWGDKPIKDLDEFKKLMTAELKFWQKQGVKALPDLKTEGCLMGASGELRTLFDDIKGNLSKLSLKPDKAVKTLTKVTSKPKTTELNTNLGL